MRIIKAGATSQTVYVEILDSTSTTGGRKTGLAYNTAGMTAYYVRNGGSSTSITLATLAAANSAYSSGGFKEVDATNMPGIYRLDLPDAAVAASATDVVVTLKGATGMVQVSLDIQLVAVDPQDSVRMGMTALPNAAAEAAGGLYTRGTGAGQIAQDANGNVRVNVDTVKTVDAQGYVGVVDSGTAQSVGATSIQLKAGAPAYDISGATVTLTSATTGQYQTRAITSYNTSTKTATVDTWGTTPTGTVTYVVFASAPSSTSSPAAVNVTQWNGAAVATPNTAGVPKVDAVTMSGTSLTARDIGASVLVSSGTGAGQISLSSGTVTVGTNNDKTGYSLTQAFPTNFSSLSITVGGAVTAGTVSDKTGYTLTSAGYNAAADALLGRNVAGGSSTGRIVSEAFYVLRNKVSISAGTLTVYGTDDTTSAWTGAVTTAAGNPISVIDPA